MANMSDAYGTVNIKTNADIQKFIECFNNITMMWEYGIYLAEEGEKVAEDEYDYSFNACGRWSFHCSLEELGRWLESEEDNQILIENDWSMTFEFLDVEGGNGVLYIEEAVVEHEANEPLSKATFQEINCQEFDYDFCSYYEAMTCFGEDDTETIIEDAKSEFLDWRDDKEREKEIANIITKMEVTKPFCDDLQYFKNLLEVA